LTVFIGDGVFIGNWTSCEIINMVYDGWLGDGLWRGIWGDIIFICVGEILVGLFLMVWVGGEFGVGVVGVDRGWGF
jgi:hypothetical protein